MKKWILLSFVFIVNVFSSSNYEQIAAQLHEVEFVHFGFTDICGNLKMITLPSSRAEDAFKEGIKFDGSSILGCSKISESDMHLAPDFSTFRILPSSVSLTPCALILCDVQISEIEIFEGAPRTLLKNVQKQFNELGFQLLCGTELEFYLLTEQNQPFDSLHYCDVSYNISDAELKNEILRALINTGIEVEKVHHEVGPGQFEIVIRYSEALQQADHIILAKYIIQLMAKKHNLNASFLPKPIDGVNGSGMHIHYSLVDQHQNLNAFYDALEPLYLSEVAQFFLAGNLAYMKELISLTNSCKNSYKRLVPGYEAPIFICWGEKNRSAMIRIPQINFDTAPKATRAEFRASDASSNPYLAFTALGISGYKGIQEKLTIPSPIHFNIYTLSDTTEFPHLPTSLDEAISLIQNSEIAQEFLDPNLLRQFIQIKEEEIKKFER